MPKFDAGAVPAHRPRDLGRFVRADRSAVAVWAAMFTVFAASTLVLVALVLEPYLNRLALVSTSAAQTVAQSVADRIGEALAGSHALDTAPTDPLIVEGAMIGGTTVEAYLSEVLDREVVISGIELRGPAETTIAARSADGQSLGGTVRVGVVVDGAVRASVIVAPSARARDQASWRLVASALAASVIFATLAATLFRIAVLERTNLPLARFGSAANAIARGTVTQIPLARDGPAQPLGQSAAQLLRPLVRDHRQTVALTEEVRALDTGGALGDRLALALSHLDGIRFGGPRTRTNSDRARLWWPLGAACALMATTPLVASFAADRVAEGAEEAIAAAATLCAYAIGAILGLSLARILRGRPGRLGIALAMVIAGVVTAQTLLNRDIVLFVGLQAVVGFCGAFALATALRGSGRWQRAPWQLALVFLAALTIGPALGALMAEALGRRLAFLAVGLVLVLVGCLAAFLAPIPSGRAHRTGSAGPGRAYRPLALAALATSGAAGSLLLTLLVPLGPMREDYAGLSLAMALAGLAALAVPALIGARRELPALPIAAALCATCPIALLAGAPALLCAPALGLGIGVVATVTPHMAVGVLRAGAFFTGIAMGAAATAIAAIALHDSAIISGPEAGALAVVILAAATVGLFIRCRTRAPMGAR